MICGDMEKLLICIFANSHYIIPEANESVREKMNLK